MVRLSLLDRDVPGLSSVETERSRKDPQGGHPAPRPLRLSLGFVVLVWYSRGSSSFFSAPGRELLWLSIGNLFYYLAGFFLAAALKEAIAIWGTPAIFNTDQGSQFTSAAFVEVLWGHGIAISMDSVDRCLDNIYVERL